MTTYGRLTEDKHIVEYGSFYDKPIFPGINWVEIPISLLPYASTVPLKVENDKVVPVDMNQFSTVIKLSIKAIRDKEQENGIVSYKDKGYPTDSKSIAVITSTVVLATIQESQNKAGSFNTTWKTNDNSFANLNLVDLITIGSLCAQHVTKCFIRESELDVEVDLADTIDNKIAILNKAQSNFFEVKELVNSTTDNTDNNTSTDDK